MSKLLILFATREGQSAKIAQKISDILEQEGHEVTLQQLRKHGPAVELDAYPLVVLGGSIHFDRFEGELVSFAREHRAELARRTCAFFFVCLTAKDQDQAAREKVAGYLDKFVEETGLHPKPVAVFAGTLAYRRYGFFKRWLMKSVAKKFGQPTDTTRDHEFTDWTEVAHFADDLDQLADEE